jgi:hypothetical protein
MTFSAEDVVAQVRALAQEWPEHVYEPPAGPVDSGNRCSYLVGSDGHGCIVGQALLRLGVNPDALSRVEGQEAATAVSEVAHLDASNDWPELDWLNHVQEAQDERKPWGVAVAAADEQAER